MDVTPLFKACVKTIRLKNKSLPVPDKNRILKKRPANSELDFNGRSKDIRHKITQLRDFLVENRAAYMKFACHLKNSAQMTDEERDLIDQESEKVVNFCTQLILDFRQDCRGAEKRSPQQMREHMQIVLETLTDYLKAVNDIHARQKKHRVQRELETYKFIKLESDKKKIPVVPYTPPKAREEMRSSEDEEEEDEALLERSDEERKADSSKERKSLSGRLSLDEEIAHNESAYDEGGKLSAEDIQMFESENVQLFHELQGLAEEVEQIERNVVDIAQLQDIFTEKVTLQKADIERISNTVVGTTENVKDANEQIKQAIQRNAGLRVWILFFLLVMSFSLLFLDWYND
ncbi:syntaxin-18 [Phlebotomus argentipes]|uniref:syntaxin-18 n=1 Tax=Phlebotomus argentipes TaxID=94469 RepID=UPI0028929C1C|nr:syntaxin-18 [Phlebotomus argentipes]